MRGGYTGSRLGACAAEDPQNSLIPKARIEAMEMRTRVKSVAVSDNAGKV